MIKETAAAALGLAFFAVAPVPFVAPAPARAAEAAPAKDAPLAAALQPFVDRGALAGAVVLVASKDKVLATEAVGYADVAAKAPMPADAVMWIASMSKPITGAALMMLADEGKLSIEDPVEKYLPEFKGQMVVAEADAEHAVLKRPAHPITIREVMSHTSGLPFMSRVENKIDARPLREAVLSYALSPLKTEPGTKYEYSNAGINTAGRIIEVVSGRPYETFLQERLFAPLGMKDTTFVPTEAQTKRLAKSYKPDAAKTGLAETTVSQLTYPLGGPGRYPCPGGGLFSTAADVARFGQMILAGGTFEGKRYLTESAIRTLTSNQAKDLVNGGKGGYGLGFSTGPKPADDSAPAPAGVCGHGGAYATDLSIDPERGLVFVYMVQHAGFPADGGKANAAFRQAAIQRISK